MILSVCIVLYNRWEISKQTMQSIADTVPKDWGIEWCVADNGSKDQTPKGLESFLKNIRGRIGLLKILDAPEKQTMVVNTTMNAATGEYILRTDNDILYSQGWFQDCFSILNDDFFKNLAFVCPTHHLRQTNSNYKPTNLCKSPWGNMVDLVSELGMNVPGNLFVRASVAADLAGFYTPFNLLHADVHYCMVAKHMGYKWGYTWKTQSKHIGHPDMATEYSQRAVHERRTEEARYSSICKGDIQNKHPQEIEFAQHLKKMISTKGKALPWHRNINVLIPSAGRRVELVKIFKDIFKIPRWNGKIFTCGCDSYMPAAHFSDGHHVVPSVFDELYIEKIIVLCKQLNIRYIFPVIDADVDIFSKNKTKILREVGTEVVVTDHINAYKCFDKELTAKMFKELGLRHPETFIKEIPKDVCGDIIIKPQYGFASKNIIFIKKTDDSIYEIPDKHIAQRVIKGKEYTVDCVSDRRFDVVSLVARERVTVRGGEVQQARVVNHLHLFNVFNNISHKLELFGPWCIQYIIDEKKEHWFIEINTRFGGGNPISCRAGQNQPLISLKVLERDFFGYHYRYLVEWGLFAMRYDNCIYGHIEEQMGVQDATGEVRLKK